MKLFEKLEKSRGDILSKFAMIDVCDLVEDDNAIFCFRLVFAHQLLHFWDPFFFEIHPILKNYKSKDHKVWNRNVSFHCETLDQVITSSNFSSLQPKTIKVALGWHYLFTHLTIIAKCYRQFKYHLPALDIEEVSQDSKGWLGRRHWPQARLPRWPETENIVSSQCTTLF